MATVAPREIPAPAGEPRRVGTLLTACGDGNQLSPDPWHGVTIWPDPLPSWQVEAACDPGKVAYSAGGNRELVPVSAQPWMLRTRVRLNTSDLEVLSDFARRQIDAATSVALAHELVTGDLTREAPWSLPDGVTYDLGNARALDTYDGTGQPLGDGRGGPFLNPTLAAAEALDPQDHPAAAVALVEAEASLRAGSGPVVVHVPPPLLLELTQFGIRPEGNQVRTPLGNVVSADAGYLPRVPDNPDGTPGDPPDEAAPLTVWATGAPYVWLDEPRVYDDPRQVVNFRGNQIACWAERLALHWFDQRTAVSCAIGT